MLYSRYRVRIMWHYVHIIGLTVTTTPTLLARLPPNLPAVLMPRDTNLPRSHSMDNCKAVRHRRRRRGGGGASKRVGQRQEADGGGRRRRRRRSSDISISVDEGTRHGRHAGYRFRQGPNSKVMPILRTVLIPRDPQPGTTHIALHCGLF